MTPLLLLAACQHPNPVALTIEASIERPTQLPSGGTLLGARALIVEADDPVAITLIIEGGGIKRTIAFEARAASQVLPVVGLRLGHDHDLTVEATDARGRVAITAPIAIEADPFPDDWPTFDVLARDPARIAPGWIAADVKASNPIVHLVFFDPEFEPAYVLSNVYDLQDADLEPDGTLLTRTDANAWSIDLLGNVVAQWGYEELDPDHYLPTDTAEFHHEVVPLGDRFATMSSRILPVSAYPISDEAPETLGGPTEIRDPSLVVIDRATGAVESQWFAADFLDPTRVGFDAVVTGEPVQDWGHGNAVAVDLDGGWLVSLRHQDLVVKLDAAGDLQWILGDPAGWKAPWSDFLLAPIAAMNWPYHPHAVWADPGSGDVVLFDNGNRGHTPYTPAPDREITSRAIGYRVDPEARTIEEAWAFEETTNGKLYSPGMGSVYVQENGNVFADYATVDQEDGVRNTARGWGEKVARWVEWAPDAPDAPVFDVRIRSDTADQPRGWTSYRAHKLAALYPTTGPWAATETRE